MPYIYTGKGSFCLSGTSTVYIPGNCANCTTIRALYLDHSEIAAAIQSKDMQKHSKTPYGERLCLFGITYPLLCFYVIYRRL
jgi:hypothetical protein